MVYEPRNVSYNLSRTVFGFFFEYFNLREQTIFVFFIICYKGYLFFCQFEGFDAVFRKQLKVFVHGFETHFVNSSFGEIYLS